MMWTKRVALLSASQKRTLRACNNCPRLVEHRHAVAEAHPEYYNRPVPCWGDRRAKLMVVGLAPGLHGAARTGQAFVGDASGELLFSSLKRHGFATQAASGRLRLTNTIITNVVKCLPPANAPSANEVNQCRDYLRQELAAFSPQNPRSDRCIVALGGVAYRALQRALDEKLQPFTHGQESYTSTRIRVLASYHPSRLNVNTGRINEQMLNVIFARAKKITR